MAFKKQSAAMRLCWRFGLLPIAIAFVLALAGFAALAASFSGRQPATVALDVGLSFIRLVLPVIAILLLQELVSREFDRKHYLISLTYPRPRYQFLLGRLSALGIVLLGLLVIAGLVLSCVVTWVAQGYQQSTPVALGWPYWTVLGFIALDLFVIVTFGALLAVWAKTPSFVLIGTLAFMLIARSFSSIVALLQRKSWLVADAETYSTSLGVLGYLLPDLAAVDVRSMALYGQWALLPPQWPWHVAMALVYGIALLSLALWVLARKRFA